jgi:hypothetical protein
MIHYTLWFARKQKFHSSKMWRAFSEFMEIVDLFGFALCSIAVDNLPAQRKWNRKFCSILK